MCLTGLPHGGPAQPSQEPSMAPLRPWVFAALASIFAPQLTAQSKEEHYTELRFTTRDGLPSNSIRALEFDESGQLWVGTLAGLSVFDGDEFTNVPISNGGPALAHRITALEFVDDGLLIGTQSGLLFRYQDDFFEPLPSSHGMAIHRIEVLDDGTIVTAGQQLAVLRDGHAEVLGAAPRQATVGLEWNGGALYAAGAWGLWKLSTGGVQQLDDRVYRSLLPAPPDALLAVHLGGIVSVDDLAPRSDFEAPVVYATLRVNERMTMLACSNSTQLVFSRGVPSGPLMLLEDDTAERPRAFAVRGRGSWIGTDRDGLLYIERTPGFHLVRTVNAPPLYASGVYPLSDNSALIQPTDQAAPVIYEQTDPRAVATLTDLAFDGVQSTRILGCTSLQGGRSWLATDLGVLRLEADTIYPTKSSGDSVRAIVESDTGEVWAAASGAIFQVLADGGRGRSLPGPDPAPSMLVARGGKLFYAVTGGLYRMDTATERAEPTRILELASAVEPRYLTLGPEGDLWLSTYGDGLLRLSENETVAEQYSETSGLRSNYLGWINFMTDKETGAQVLLANSNQGLMRVPLPELKAGLDTVGTLTQGLTSKESEGDAGARLECGTVLLPTLDGLMGYNLQQSTLFVEPPQALIDSVVVNGEFMDEAGEFALARVFGSADVDIGFGAIAMPSTADATFSYRLIEAEAGDPAEVSWVDSYSAKSVQYFNLPPGAYTFQVRTKLPDSYWSQPASLEVVRVLPYLYQRPQVQIALLAVLLMLVVYSFARFIRAEGATQLLSSKVEESKTLAAEAAQREARYARLLDSSHDGIVLIEADGQISFANEAMTRSFGFERDELLERDAAWLGIPDVVSILAGVDGATKTGDAGPLLSRNVQVIDKFAIPHESDLIAARTELDGQECLLVVIRDLTADNRLLDRLDTSERRFQALFQGAPAALITFSNDLRIIDWNRRAEALLGLGNTLTDELTDAFDNEASRLRFREQVDKTTKTRSETKAIHEALGRDGVKLRISWTISPLSTDMGKVTVLMAVAKDLREEERAEARLKELQRRLAMAEESERSRIAREIHDDLSQRLAATSMNTATIRARLPEGVDAEVSSLLTGLHGDLERLMADIHALSRQLHPTVLDDLGLSKAIGSECDRQDSLTDARIAFLGPELDLKLPSDIGLAFFRITQESIRNAIKHANPSKVEVRLEQVGSRLRLSVVDDGDGFEMKDGRDDSSAGLGLVSMQERARLMGADFRMTSSPGSGTQITVEVSLESPSNSPTGP